jgi:thioredoxin 1
MTQQATTKFHEFVAASDVPVLVDFYADWCGPCHAMAPILNDLKATWGDKIKIIKVDTERQQNIAAEFQITGIPTLIMFKGGKNVHRTSGVMPLQKLMAEYGKYL